MSKQNYTTLSSEYSPGKAQRRQRFQRRLEHMRREKAQRYGS